MFRAFTVAIVAGFLSLVPAPATADASQMNSGAGRATGTLAQPVVYRYRYYRRY